MKFKASKVPHFFLGAAFIFLLSPSFAAERAELIFDNELVKKTDLKVINGADHLPLKSVAALFKGNTQWQPVANKVILQLNNRKVVFNIGKREALAGSEKIMLSEPARMVDGTIFVPVEFFTKPPFTEIADCDVRWDRSLQMLKATSKTTLELPRIYSGTRRTQLMIESTEDFSPDVRKKGDILTIDIPKAKIAHEESMSLTDRHIKQIRINRARKGAQIKLELAQGVTYYKFVTEHNPPRLILEVRSPAFFKKPGKEDLEEINLPERLREREEPAQSAPALSTAVIDASTANGKEISSAPAAGDLIPVPVPVSAGKKKTDPKIKTIVVDAGHGGKDPGALGRGGTKEKDINLLIALELARILKIEGGYNVFLTRTDDTFVPLIDRSLFANDAKADLFISIHCNASIRKMEGGFEIYYLAEEASDPHAEEAEKLENAVIHLEEPMSPKKKKLQDLLFSMAQTQFINESSLLSHAVNRSIKKRVQVQNRGVKQANFHVLHGVNMPSVLVECAFLTHKPDEQKLRSRKWRSSIVDAVLTGIQNYETELVKLQR